MKRAFGGSTFSFMWQEPALAAMRKLRALGLNDFDVILAPGHCWPAELSPPERARMAAALHADDMRIESLNLPAIDLNLASCVPEVRAQALALYTQALQLSADLGGRAVVVVPGRVSALFAPPQRASEGWLAESLEQLLAVAERVGQFLYLESHPQTPIPTVAAIEGFLTTIADPRLKVAYDVANAEFVAEDQPAALRRLAPRLGQVHLSDGTRTHWRHDRVGLGTVDFKRILAALADTRFAGVALLEIISATPLEDFSASLNALAA